MTLAINTVHHGDCLALMQQIPAGSIDMILCDLPYGTTACAWDTVIPFEPLWAEYRRIIKPNGAIVLTAAQPFTTDVVGSNRAWFRYALVWEKPQATNPMLAKVQPLKSHEDICIFYGKAPTYTPQMGEGRPFSGFTAHDGATIGEVYGKGKSRHAENHGTRYPKSVLKFAQERKGLHPTQKPVPLWEYLIRTYTQPGETVLDNCLGSGTTAIACINSGRNWIGIEQDAKYVEVARRRIADHKGETRVLANGSTQLGFFSEAK